jgi:hypothetical protein
VDLHSETLISFSFFLISQVEVYYLPWQMLSITILDDDDDDE